MNHIFISHVEEDEAIALEIANSLESAGYSTWYYERDSFPGPSYLLQTGQAIENSGAVIVVISSASLRSHQVTKEIVRAHETSKPFLPILRDIKHTEFQQRQPEWREALGSATSVRVPPEGVSLIVAKIVGGLQALGVRPEQVPGTSKATSDRSSSQQIASPSTQETEASPADIGVCRDSRREVRRIVAKFPDIRR